MDTDGTETARYRHSPGEPPPVSLFDADPATYDRARPHYPPQLYADLFTSLDVPGPDILEIGPGTGKATRDLLRYAATLTAVELGPRLSAFLRTTFAGEPRLTVINAAFETAPLSASSYDLVVAATAFHWLDPSTRLARAHSLLRANGALAVIDTVQVSSDVDRGYFARSFPVYRRYRPDEPEPELLDEHVVPGVLSEIEHVPEFFEPPTLARYRWDQRYTTTQYADLVRSYSNTETMEAAAREGLIADLSALINAEFDGYVIRPLVITLVMARVCTGR